MVSSVVRVGIKAKRKKAGRDSCYMLKGVLSLQDAITLAASANTACAEVRLR